MNILKMEIKLTWKESLVWTVSIAIIVALLSAFFPSFRDSMGSIEKLFEKMPKMLLDSMGFDISSFGSFPAYLSYIINYILIGMGIYSMKLGLMITSREKTIGMSDFLVVKPCSRQEIVLYKYVAGAITITAMVGILFALSAVLNTAFGGGSMKVIVYTYIAVYLISLFFLSLGSLVSSLLKRNKSILSIAMAVTFVFYFILMIQRMFSDNKLKYLSPFAHLDTSKLILVTSFEEKFLMLNISLTVIMLIASVFLYSRENFRK